MGTWSPWREVGSAKAVLLRLTSASSAQNKERRLRKLDRGQSSDGDDGRMKQIPKVSQQAYFRRRLFWEFNKTWSFIEVGPGGAT